MRPICTTNAPTTTVSHWSNGATYEYAGMWSKPACSGGRRYPGYVLLVNGSGETIRVRADRVMVTATS